jgi:hypothetical protein
MPAIRQDGRWGSEATARLNLEIMTGADASQTREADRQRKECRMCMQMDDIDGMSCNEGAYP